jgi:acetyl-CoA carboxylase carboxyl transferase subunit alpha
MLQNAIYSVISPEGCATILWRDPKKTLEAAQAMKLSSKDLLDLKVIDEIISEPLGGAHRDKDLILNNVRNSITNNLNDFNLMSKDEVLNHRKNKFLSIGRSKGFIRETKTDDSLHMKQNFLDILKIKIIKNKNQLIIASIVLILTALIFLIL